jgi:chromosome segregation ATPase
MDPAVLVQNAPSYALAAMLAGVLWRVMRWASTTFADYRADADALDARYSKALAAAEQRYHTALQATEERHAAELQRQRLTYETELDSLRADVGRLRDQLGGAIQDLDAERRARWRAEDVAAQARRLADPGASTTTDGRP